MARGPGVPRTYVRAFLPTHFHLLVRTTDQPLAQHIRTRLRGYAANFNHLYRRFLHAFQMAPGVQAVEPHNP